jgi:hypothetical protein
MMGLLFTSTLGLVLMLQIQQELVRREVKQQLKLGVNEEELFTFIIPNNLQEASASGFKWVRPNKEFRYKGGMYDVIRKKKHAKTTEYTCISDTKEAEIFTQLEQLVNQGVSNNPEQQQQRGYCFQMLKTLFYQPINQFGISKALTDITHDTAYKYSVSNPHIRLFVAPPELLA